MARPSIFSKDYERHKRRQKRRLILVVLLLMLISGGYFFSGSLKNIVNGKISFKKNLNIFALVKSFKKDDALKDSEKKQGINSENSAPAQQTEVEEKGYEITLSDGSKVKAIYETKDGTNKFKYVTPIEAQISFSINPSGTAMIIYEKKTQEMTYVDINQKIQKINDNKYESTSHYVYNREDTIKNKPGYVWCNTPKFIDDDNVAFISQVPWFDEREEKYVWVFNSKDDNYKVRNGNDLRLNESLCGKNLKLGNITDKGLEVIMDDATKYIKFNEKDYQISQ